jgi:hypothetical protein
LAAIWSLSIKCPWDAFSSRLLNPKEMTLLMSSWTRADHTISTIQEAMYSIVLSALRGPYQKRQIKGATLN